MSKRTVRREAFEGVEPDGILGEEAPPRPKRGQTARPPNLQEALATVVLTVGARLVEEWLRGPRAAPAPAPGKVLRVCPGTPETHDLCGARYVESNWRTCPYCGAPLMAVQ